MKGGQREGIWGTYSLHVPQTPFDRVSFVCQCAAGIWKGFAVSELKKEALDKSQSFKWGGAIIFFLNNKLFKKPGRSPNLANKFLFAFRASMSILEIN